MIKTGRTQATGKGVYIAESADIIGDVRLNDDVSIWHGSVLRGDVNYIEVGEGSNIQDLSAGHVRENIPLIIGKGVTIGHAVKLHACTIEDYCLIGIGAIVLDGAVIGEGSIVAAGSLVPPNTKIQPRTLVMGIPCKTRRKVTDKEYEHIIESYKNYIEYKNVYLKSK